MIHPIAEIKKNVIAFLSFIIVIVPATYAQSETAFYGVPNIKISEGGIERTSENLKRDRAVNLACMISKIEGKYYWASRENTPLISVASGAFV